MNAFVTGSRVYGTPREDSDVDLCVVMSFSDFELLRGLADSTSGSFGDSLVFGRLNLLVLNPVDFVAWKEATAGLEAIKPVTREKAVEAIEAVKERNKLSA